MTPAPIHTFTVLVQQSAQLGLAGSQFSEGFFCVH
jgi:hypothetical protein